MKFTIDKLILWPANPNNALCELSFKSDKISIIHGISGTGKSSIISIIDYCLGASKCAIPVGLIRESVLWFGLKINIRGQEFLLARKTPGDKSVSTEYHFSPYFEDIPLTITTTHSDSSFKNEFNQRVNLSDLLLTEEKDKVGFDGRASYRDMAAFNFLPQHIVANPYTLFFKADSYQNRERLKRVMPFALGIIDREYMINEKERLDIQKRLDALIKEQDVNKKALASWDIDVDHLWKSCVELGLLNLSETPSSDKKIESLNYINKVYIEGNIEKLLGKPNYEFTNERIKTLTIQGENIQREIDTLRVKIRNLEQLSFRGKDFTQAIKKEKEHVVGFTWLKENLYPEGECIACGSKTNALSSIVDNLERKISKLNSVSDILSDNPITDKEIHKLKKELRDQQDILYKVRKEKFHFEKIDKSTNDSLNKVYVLIGRIQETLSSLRKVKNTDDTSEKIKTLEHQLNELNKYFRISNKEQKEYLVYNRINSLIEKYADKFGLERRGSINLDKKELTLSFKRSEYGKNEFLWEVGSGANWMGYHISTFLALHEYLSGKDQNHLPPFSFLVIDQPSQVYFPSADSGDNILDKISADQDLKITRQNDIISTRRIFEMLSNAIEENNYNFQVIVLEHAGESIWGQVKNTYEVANWKDEGDGLIPKEWLQ
ncbi:DUF3732 domain-containing protein [Citrobacter freundii]|uniref:DUF3732 domain-containing protein n=1 Tax=Citrobacter freundii TaxID=546 RepID=UPI0018AB082E|nr:DUF3732 domain-containing protein [Citrobacter freundii]